MRILVLQHVDVEHPGIFRDFMRAEGLSWDTVELDQGEAIPDVSHYDLMLVMGGPQDVWQEKEFPWLREEKAAIRQFVADLRRPFLGVCLGHQLLADALGGKVGPALQPEVGVLTINKTPDGLIDPILGGISNPATVLQWHGAEVLSIPEGAAVLAFSDRCAIQAFRYGRHAYGVQFHVELTRETVAAWAEIPVYAAALNKALGSGAAMRLKEQVDGLLPAFNRDALVIYDRFMSLIRQNGLVGA